MLIPQVDGPPVAWCDECGCGPVVALRAGNRRDVTHMCMEHYVMDLQRENDRDRVLAILQNQGFMEVRI